MIAAKDSIGPHSSDQLPNSRKTYADGKIFAYLRVPFREVSLANTNGVNGTVEANPAVRLYDTSGPWGDPAVACDVREGLPRCARHGSKPAATWRFTRGGRFFRSITVT